MRRLVVQPSATAATATAVAVAVALLLGSLLVGDGAAGAEPRPVPGLGSAAHLAPIGSGWGTVRPTAISNGGDPAGSVDDLSWRDWGERRTLGRGQTWIFRPGGGYYRRPAPILLRAQDVGRCDDGSYAYRHLWFRVAHRPDGPLGRRWHRWGGGGDLCRRY